MQVKFSILIPAYKGRFLDQAIASVLAQTFRDFELVIIDDHSPEDLLSIVSGFEDNRIVFHRNEKNSGAIDVVDNWNRCLMQSRGDYVICIGDDDRLLPGCLECLASLIEKYPGLGVYHLQSEVIDESGKVIETLPERKEFENVLEMMHLRFSGKRKQFIGDFCFDSKLLRRENGFYKLPLAWGSDDVSVTRAALSGGIANTNDICFQYRENRSSITRSKGYSKLKLKAYRAMRRWYLKTLCCMVGSYGFLHIFRVYVLLEIYILHLRLVEIRKLV